MGVVQITRSMDKVKVSRKMVLPTMSYSCTH